MTVFAVVVVACLSLIVVPVLILLCGEGDSEKKSSPKLKSIKKKHSTIKAGVLENGNSNGSINHVSEATIDSEKVTVLSDGPAVAAYEEIAGVPNSSNAYDEPGAIAANSKIINDTITTKGTRSSIVNEVSPVSSQRSSRASNSQTRVTSQDRALPDLPGQEHSARHSITSERSPSTKRALPDIPAGLSALPLEDDGSDLYDELNRNVAPNQIKAKSKSVKGNAQLAMGAEDDYSEEIQPDEVTRNSVVFGGSTFSPTTQTNELYCLVGDPGASTSEPVKPSGTSLVVNSPDDTKHKAKAPYSKVKKESSKNGVKSPTNNQLNEAAEPIYSAAPPVPLKMYDPNVEAGEAGAVNMRSVNVVVDDQATDSGSGYYAVAGDDPSPNLEPTQPESYDTLTARESIATVRARQASKSQVDDDYECVDEKQEGSGSIPTVSVTESYTDGGTEIYAEIDNLTGADEIDLLSASNAAASGAVGSQRKLLAPSHASDPGYEKVDFSKVGSVKVNGPASSSNGPVDDDEEDYAECDPLPAGASANSISASSAQLSRAGSDVSDYATVEDSTRPPLPQSSLPNGTATTSQVKPFQKYSKRKEHLYQEIDEVREEAKNPPDKKN